MHEDNPKKNLSVKRKISYTGWNRGFSASNSHTGYNSQVINIKLCEIHYM